MNKRFGEIFLPEKTLKLWMLCFFWLFLQRQDCLCDLKTLQMYDYILNMQVFIVFYLIQVW